MCCIVHREKDAKEISQINLEKIIKANPDGWGISYMSKGKLKVIRSLEMNDAIAAVREAEKENAEFLFHARWTTHGETILENCHPYDVSNGVMFHNGKIDIRCRNKKYSDTYYFSLLVNRHLKKKKSIDKIVTIFKKIIGPSRLAFMTTSGEVIKFGDWHLIDGISYSKDNWKYRYHKDDFYSGSYGGWEGCGGYYETPYQKTRQRSLYPESSRYKENEDTLKEVLMNCQKGEMLYTYLLKELSKDELAVVAREYPAFAAAYLVKICR